MASKNLWKVGGIGGHGYVEVLDTNGSPQILINGVPTVSAASNAAIAALTPLVDPNTATSVQIATLLNQVVAALKSA